jgi:hypothetical protein
MKDKAEETVKTQEAWLEKEWIIRPKERVFGAWMQSDKHMSVLVYRVIGQVNIVAIKNLSVDGHVRKAWPISMIIVQHGPRQKYLRQNVYGGLPTSS